MRVEAETKSPGLDPGLPRFARDVQPQTVTVHPSGPNTCCIDFNHYQSGCGQCAFRRPQHDSLLAQGMGL